jgi:hypothetical protein
MCGKANYVDAYDPTTFIKPFERTPYEWGTRWPLYICSSRSL